MADFQGTFEMLGLSSWCENANAGGPMTMAELLARKNGEAIARAWWDIPFPSLDTLNKACPAIDRTRDMTNGLESGFLTIKDPLKAVLDPLTQPLSWALDSSLSLFTALPWWLMISFLVALSFWATRKYAVTVLVAVVFLVFLFIDHYTFAIQTLAIIFVCTTICVLLGVPIGIAMSNNNRLQKIAIPLLDMLQTLPTFVYLIPLIFLFNVTEPKLYGIAIILYAIVPVIRLTDLGIRLVDQEVTEAADAFGMTSMQKLVRVEIPLALPNIMAGVNQTIMMSLSMVVIASLVSAPGLGVLVLRGINKLELGVGLVAGAGIVLLAIVLDRVSKAALDRINKAQAQ